MSHPTRDLDDAVHQRVRLGILTIAQEAARTEFTFLQDTLGVTAGNLSRHIATLQDAGLLRVDKGFERHRPRTWVRITPAGRRSLAREIRALKAVIHQVEAARASETAAHADNAATASTPEVP